MATHLYPLLPALLVQIQRQFVSQFHQILHDQPQKSRQAPTGQFVALQFGGNVLVQPSDLGGGNPRGAPLLKRLSASVSDPNCARQRLILIPKHGSLLTLVDLT